MIRSSSARLTLALVVLASPLTACGGGDDDGGEESPDARDSTTPDAAPVDSNQPSGETVISNLPGLEWEAKPGSLPGLTIVSSNFTQENLGGSIYQHWYAEIRNGGSATICYAKATVDLQGAGGETLATMSMYADTLPYDTGSTVSATCVGPGATAALYDIEIPGAEAPIAQISRASWIIEGLESPTAQLHPLTPTISGAVYEWNPGYWAVQGTVIATGGIRNIGLDVYPIGPSGWIVDHLSDTNLGSLSTGASWSYQTTTYRGERFSDYHQYVSFIEGTSATAVAATADPAVERAETAMRAAKAERRELRARRDAARR